MRKMKKINGYLVVKFNDRELREWDGTALGNYGVIDAELYTGTLEVDRGAMEYDDAETLEAAVELARGLEAELDVVQPFATYTLIRETENGSTEDEVNPEGLFNAAKATLEREIKSKHYPDTDPRTAAHELYGYARALVDVGLAEDNDERFWVIPNVFGGYEIPQPLPREPEELLAYICDEKCKERTLGRTQEELEAICAKCAVERLANEGDDRDLHIHSAAANGLNELIRELRRAGDFQERRICNAEARAYLRALTTAKVITEGEKAAFDAAIKDAVEAQPCRPPREQFENIHPPFKNASRQLYTLALALEGDCPDNDCRVFLNMFHMAQELDTALDTAQGYAADVLRHKLLKEFQELREMYNDNCAVKKYREGAQV